MAKNFFDRYMHKQLKSFESLSNKVKDELNNSLMYRKASLTGFLSRCDSPIEQLLAIHLIDLDEELTRALIDLEGFKGIELIPQKKVEVNEQKYRLDFFIECAFKEKTYKFVVECDGHDFHEKTKEQAARDKSRERNLITAGYTVIRFTGSEIWKNPIRCARDVRDIITKKVGFDDHVQKVINEMI